VLKLNDKVIVKVLEVDIPRKRIALSIKQTQEMPDRQESQRKSHQPNRPKQAENASGNMNDALNLLKKKFGK